MVLDHPLTPSNLEEARISDKFQACHIKKYNPVNYKKTQTYI